MSARFHPLTITEIRRETIDSVSLSFAVPPDLADTFRFQAGQHLTLRTALAGEEIRRNYSLCVSPLEDELRVAIKTIPGGAFSGWANSELKPGAILEVMPPHGSFVLRRPAGFKPNYVAFAGGSGITPILSLLKTVLMSDPDGRFTLFYGNRDSASVMFLDELAGLKDRFLDRLQLLHILSQEDDELGYLNGLLDKAKCTELLRDFVDPAEVAAFYICGPGPMMDAVEAALLDAGVPKSRLFIERFTVGALTEAQAAAAKRLEQEAAGLPITVTLGGRRRTIAFDAAKGSILESAQAAGLGAPFACKGGVCATCRARVLEGKVEMKRNFGLTAEEVAHGYVLTCQAVPIGPGVVIDYDG